MPDPKQIRTPNSRRCTESFPIEPHAVLGTADNTTWTYDIYSGALLQKTYPDGSGPSYSYTSAGTKVASRTWARAVPASTPPIPLVTTYSYNWDSGDLTGVTYSDSTPSVSFTYKRDGRVDIVDDGAGTRVFSYSTTTLDLTSEALPSTSYGSRSLTRQYDTLGRNSGVSVVTGGSPSVTEYQVGYGYDTATGRFNAATSSLFSGSVAYGYLADSDALESATFPNGLVVTRTYEDHRDLVASIENKVGTTVVSKYEYTNDAAGRRTAAVRSGTAFAATDTLSYGYNSRSEVTGALSSEAATNDYSYIFDYDPMGNRLLTTRGLAAPATTSYTTSNVNAYTDVTTSAGTVNPTYDADGNVDFLPAAAGSGAPDWSFTWDAENRLVFAESATVRVEMVYDYLSRRVAKKVYTGSTTAGWTLQRDTRFLYDGWNLVAEIDATSTAPTIWYVWGLDQSQSVHGAGGIGGLLCSSSFSSSSSSSSSSSMYFTFDANGNVSELLDGTGAVQAHYEYDPYGNLTVLTGLAPTVTANPFRFSTKYLDGESALYYYGYRWYSPDLGRWLSRDPLNEEGGINLLAFCGNDGVNGFDPMGLKLVWDKNEIGSKRYYHIYWEDEYGKLSLAYWYAKVTGFPGSTRTYLRTLVLDQKDECAAADELTIEKKLALLQAKFSLSDLRNFLEGAIDTAFDLLPGSQVYSFGTGQTLTGQEVSRVQAASNLAIGAIVGGKIVRDSLLGESARTVPSGRQGKQLRLREIAQESSASSADRGWIRQEINSIERGQRTNIRVPPGKNLAHRRGYEARKGFDYEHSDLQDIDLHKIQHKHEGY